MYAVFAILVVLSWGLNFSFTKIVVEEVPIAFLLFIRFSLTGLIFLPFAKFKNINWKGFLAIALSLNVAHFGFCFASFYFLEASTISVLQQSQVPMAVLLALLFFKEKVSILQFWGIAIALAGLVVIFGLPNLNPLGTILILLGAFFWAASQQIMKKLGKTSIPTFASITGLMSAPFLLALSFLLGEKPSMEKIMNSQIAGIISYQVIILGLSMAIWQKLMTKYGVNKISPFALLQAIFAIIGAHFILNEQMNIYIAVGAGLTILGVFLTTYKKKNKSI